MKMNSRVLLGLGILVLVGVIGWGVYSANNSNKGSFIPGIGGGPPGGNLSIDPSEFRIALQTLFPQHGVLVNNHLQSLFDQRDTNGTREALEENSQHIAIVIERAGGPKDEFLKLWKEHITGYENYTKALSGNDREGTNQARSALSVHARGLSELFNRMVPEVTLEQAAQGMEDHIDLTLGIIEAYWRGDTEKRLFQMSQASAQAFQFANLLADGMSSK